MALLPRFQSRLAEVQHRPVAERPAVLTLWPALSPHIKDFSLPWIRDASTSQYRLVEQSWRPLPFGMIAGLCIIAVAVICRGLFKPIAGVWQPNVDGAIIAGGVLIAISVARSLLRRTLVVDSLAGTIVMQTSILGISREHDYRNTDVTVMIHKITLLGSRIAPNTLWKGFALVVHFPDQALTVCMSRQEADIDRAQREIPAALCSTPVSNGIRIDSWYGWGL